MEQPTEARDGRPLKDCHVFLSGPMTGYEHNNAAAFAVAHALAVECGARGVYNPAAMWLAHAGGPYGGYTHEDWMRLSVNELTRQGSGGVPYYDAVICIPDEPDMPPSRGAALERDVAQACGIWLVDVGDLMS